MSDKLASKDDLKLSNDDVEDLEELCKKYNKYASQSNSWEKKRKKVKKEIEAKLGGVPFDDDLDTLHLNYKEVVVSGPNEEKFKRNHPTLYKKWKEAQDILTSDEYKDGVAYTYMGLGIKKAVTI